jgi:hypothetical protein
MGDRQNGIQLSQPDVTLDTGGTVLFRQKDFELLKSELETKGHVVAPLNFGIGDGPLDLLIDMPPFAETNERLARTHGKAARLKSALSGIPSTGFGTAVQKKQ